MCLVLVVSGDAKWKWTCVRMHFALLQ